MVLRKTFGVKVAEKRSVRRVQNGYHLSVYDSAKSERLKTTDFNDVELVFVLSTQLKCLF